MHELGIMIEVVRQVEQVAEQNHVKNVKKLVMQVGEAASVLPHFLHACFPAACYGTSLEGCELELEMLPAMGRCRECQQVYALKKNNGRCSSCGKRNFELISGREFILKEIVVEDEEED